jgi:hypothetical protein
MAARLGSTTGKAEMEKVARSLQIEERQQQDILIDDKISRLPKKP